LDPMHARLVAAARDVARHSYSPYSHFAVGAALLGDDGGIYCGTNVENASFGLSLCAERSAVSRAVAEGVTRFRALAVVTDTDVPTPPCGACRQVLLEFGPELEVILAGRGEDVVLTTIAELVPHPFTSFTGADTESR